MRINSKTVITYIIIFLSTIKIYGQDSLQVKYDNLLKDSETFQQYKVIPKTSLDAFWSEAVDSLRNSKTSTIELKNQINSLNERIELLNTQVSETQEKLDASLETNDTIHFIGIPFSKLAYHLMVWGIIIVLVVLGGLAYTMFLRSNKQTTKFKKELVSISMEFESHRDKAREQQMKLKRELQTAVNQLSERR